MSDILKRQPGETAAEYAERMRDVVRIIAGRVSTEAGRWVDFDDVIEDHDWIIAQGDDEQLERLWALQRAIGKIVDRMTDIGRLQRVLIYEGASTMKIVFSKTQKSSAVVR